MRVIGKIAIFGVEKALRLLVSDAAIPNGELKQIGLNRTQPDNDSWSYSSAWYRFDTEHFEEEIQDFLTIHSTLAKFKIGQQDGINHAALVICPVGQSDDESFGFVLNQSCLKRLNSVGLVFEFAPATAMPDVPFFKST